jgi:hypothetical protein
MDRLDACAYLSVLPNFHNKELTSAAGSTLNDEAMHGAILLNPFDGVPVRCFDRRVARVMCSPEHASRASG